MVGNGMAGVRTLEEAAEARARRVRHHGFRGRATSQLQPDPVVAGAWPGEQTLDQIMLNDRAWYAANGSHLHRQRRS
jgi:nitrite reductase (NADH) large subunit